MDSARKASRSHDLDEIKSSHSKYDFYGGLMQQDAFKGLVLLMSI